MTKPKDKGLSPIGPAVVDFFRREGIVRRIDLASVVDRWAMEVGPQIAAVTQAEAVTADGILWVRTATSAWAHELSLMAPKILARLNAGRDGRIREIRWRVGL
jgi:predicted nucleic acid-binding Zn ribbon protein